MKKKLIFFALIFISGMNAALCMEWSVTVKKDPRNPYHLLQGNAEFLKKLIIKEEKGNGCYFPKLYKAI